MENKMVRKANTLIEASYKLTAVEQKIIAFLATAIHPDDKDFQPYPIRIKEFQYFTGSSSNNYERVEEIILHFKEKNLRIVYPNDEGKKVILNVSWLSSCRYTEGSGKVELCFDPSLKPFFLQLKTRYTKYSMKNIVQLRSQFSIRVYELLKQYEKLGQRLFTVQELKETLGIEEGQYRLYADFKRKVILVAQDELARKTDISFSFEEIKDGRSVGQIRFFIKSKTHEKAQLAEAEIARVVTSTAEINPSEGEDLRKLIALLPQEYQGRQAISKLLGEFLAKHDLDYVARNIEYANDGSNAVNPGVSRGKGSNYRNYLAKALQGDFGLASKEDQEVNQAQEEKARHEREAAAHAARQAREKTLREQEDRDRARIYRESLSPEALETLKEEALASMDPAHREALDRKSTGSEMLLKIAMDRICMKRMKIT